MTGCRNLTWLSIACFAMGVAATAWAQKSAQKPAQKSSYSPEVQAVLETNPESPLELARAAKILADLEQPDLAKGLLQGVLKAGLDESQLAGLAEKLGTTMFTSMAENSQLAPEAKRLADAVLKAVNRKLQDPARLAKLIEQLQDPADEVRARAVAGLRKARGAAVAPLVAVLADPRRAAECPAVRGALIRLGSDATRPLVGVLEAPDPQLVIQSIRVLAEADARNTTVFLLAPFASPKSSPQVQAAAGAALERLTGNVPDNAQASRVLARRSRDYFDGKEPLRTDENGRVTVWQWDSSKKQSVAKSYPADEALIVIAARLARAAFAVAAADEQTRLLYLATMLEQASYETGLDKPLAMEQGTPGAQAAQFGPSVIEDVLEFARAAGHMPAATAAARILGHTGTAGELLAAGREPAVLARAARSSDRRLRFAAVEAIMNLQPARPFAGSSHVIEALGYFAASGGTRRALVAGPRTEMSRRIAGWLVPMGYDVDTAVTGRETIRRLIASPDYELALIDVTIERPAISFVLEQLRQDCRTASLPVGVLGTTGRFDQARLAARHKQITKPLARPHDAKSVRWQVQQLLAAAGRKMVSHAERQRQAAQAIVWLAELGSRPEGVYDIKRAEDSALAALYVPHLGQKAIAVLETLGTPASQRALVEVASRFTQPLPLRRRAMVAFRKSTRKHGILLTGSQITLQYDRYNQSKSHDAATQQVLGAILDCIEAHSKPIEPTDEKAND